MFDLQFQHIIHTVSFRCLTFISPDLKRFQHETSTTLTATTNSSSHENTLVQRAHARFPLARGGYNNSRQCQSHFRSPTETPVSGLLLETNNKTIKLKCSAFDIFSQNTDVQLTETLRKRKSLRQLHIQTIHFPFLLLIKQVRDGVVFKRAKKRHQTTIDKQFTVQPTVKGVFC